MTGRSNSPKKWTRPGIWVQSSTLLLFADSRTWQWRRLSLKDTAAVQWSLIRKTRICVTGHCAGMHDGIITKLGTYMEQTMGYPLVTLICVCQDGNCHVRAWKHGLHISQKNERNELNFDGCLVTSWGSGPQMSISLPVYILSAPIRARARASSHPYLRSADLAQSITVII